MAASLTRARVGLFPAGERDSRRRLFAALEEAYPISFEGRAAGEWRELDGLLIFGPEAPSALPPNLPVLHALEEERRQDSTRALTFAGDAGLARPLRAAKLTDGWSPSLEGTEGAVWEGRRTIATAQSTPVWATGGDRAGRELVCAAPAELAEGEALRDRLAPGRCLALLALTHFLRTVARDSRLHDAQLQAAFVLDDPNLHWPSYGHVSYRELAGDALAHGYHVAVAMVPLDGWLAHPRVVRIFKESQDRLSICVHGNDHNGAELGRVSSDREGVALAGQALQRAGAFERRTGIAVDRVMVPPHEQLSRPAARGLLACGYRAVCVSRPYPWIAVGPDQSPLVAPPRRGALAGWTPREIVAGGLPLLLRTGFTAPREDLVLRAYLGQPLILYAHHDLLEHGPEVLADAAADINALGDVRWGSLAGMARSGEVERDRGIELTLDALPSPRPRLSPLLRRIITEGRDRAQALRPRHAPGR
jgi:hypothetical protein